jgi:hypothetical protein
MLQERPLQAACSGQDGEKDRRENQQENTSHTEPEIPSANIVSTHQPLLVVVARNRSATNTFAEHHPDQPSWRHLSRVRRSYCCRVSKYRARPSSWRSGSIDGP